MVLVKINTPVHYHVKKYRICKNKICQIPGTFFDGNMVVSAGMAHMGKSLQDFVSAMGFATFSIIAEFHSLVLVQPAISCS